MKLVRKKFLDLVFALFSNIMLVDQVKAEEKYCRFGHILLPVQSSTTSDLTLIGLDGVSECALHYSVPSFISSCLYKP
jgi:hypothetical protein